MNAAAIINAAAETAANNLSPEAVLASDEYRLKLEENAYLCMSGVGGYLRSEGFNVSDIEIENKAKSKVVFDFTAQTSSTNGKKILTNPLVFFQRFKDLPLTSICNLVMTSVFHECAHILFTDFRKLGIWADSLLKGEWWPNPPKEDASVVNRFLCNLSTRMKVVSFAKGIVCSVEDGYIEKEMSRAYPGRIAELLYRYAFRKVDNSPATYDREDVLGSVRSLVLKKAVYDSKSTIASNVPEHAREVFEKISAYVLEGTHTRNIELRYSDCNEILVLAFNLAKDECESDSDADSGDSGDSGDSEGSNGAESAENTNGSEGSEGSNASENSEGSESSEGLGSSENSTSENSDSEKGDEKKGQKKKSSGEMECKSIDEKIEYMLEKANEESGDDDEDELNSGYGVSLTDPTASNCEASEETSGYTPNNVSQMQQSRGENDAQTQNSAGQTSEDGSSSDGDNSANGDPAEGKGSGNGSGESDSSMSEKADSKEGDEVLEGFGQTLYEAAKKDIGKRLGEAQFERERKRYLQDETGACRLLRSEEVSVSDIEKYNRYLENVRPVSRKMQKEILQLFKDKRESSTVRNLVLGRRFEARTVVNGSGKYFSKKILPTEKPKLRVDMLVDLSGSVKENIDDYIKAAMAVDDFCSALEVSHRILGYEGTSAENAIVHSFVEPDTITGKDKYRICQMQAGDSTPTKRAMRYALQSLEKAHEEYRVLLVVTDGGSSDAQRGELERMVEANKRRGIAIIAAGIGRDAKRVQDDFGKDNFINVTKPEDMAVTFCKLIKRCLPI